MDDPVAKARYPLGRDRTSESRRGHHERFEDIWGSSIARLSRALDGQRARTRLRECPHPFRRRQCQDAGISRGESNGRIPAIDDHGFKLWESMAINLYLAKKHGSGLLPKTMEDEAQAIQWSFWAMTEVEKPALAVLLHRFFLPEDQRDSKLADEGEQQLQNRWRCSINGWRRPVI